MKGRIRGWCGGGAEQGFAIGCSCKLSLLNPLPPMLKCVVQTETYVQNTYVYIYIYMYTQLYMRTFVYKYILNPVHNYVNVLKDRQIEICSECVDQGGAGKPGSA